MPKFKIKAAPKCTVCKKSAYPAERIEIFDLVVHKLCFNCTTCATKLTLGNASINTKTGLLFCKTHFADQLRTTDGERFATGPKNVAKKMKAAMEKKAPGSSKSAAQGQSQGGLLTEDLEVLRLAKYDTQLEAQVKDWLEDVSGKSLAEHHDPTTHDYGAFSGGLSDGVVLCYFMQTLAPGSIPQIQESSQPFKQMENIKHFLSALRTEFKFAENEVFETMDLRDEKNLNQVLQAMCTLHRKVNANSKIAHFAADHKLSVRDMSGEVEKAEQELARKRQAKTDADNMSKKTTPSKSPTSSPTPSKSTPTSTVSTSNKNTKPDYSKSEFYMMINEENHGPYTGVDMSSWFTAGDVSPECWCSCDGGDWKQAKDFFQEDEAKEQPKAPEVKAAEPKAAPVETTKASTKKDLSGSEFYMMINDENHGPYTGVDMSSWFTAGDVSPECWCSCDGGEWKQAKDFFQQDATVTVPETVPEVKAEQGKKDLSGSEFYMMINDENHGPYTGVDMSTWFTAGDVSPECWCSCDGGEWTQAKDLF